jgi:hypothetical protein
MRRPSGDCRSKGRKQWISLVTRISKVPPPVHPEPRVSVLDAEGKCLVSQQERCARLLLVSFRRDPDIFILEMWCAAQRSGTTAVYPQSYHG